MAIKAEAFMTDRHDLVTVVLPNPGAGNILVWPVPANQVVQIVCVRFQITTSIVAANRLAVVYIQAPGAIDGPISPAFIEQIANLTWTYDFSVGIAPLDHTVNHVWLFQPLACCYQGKESDNLVVGVNNIDVGDTITDVTIRCFVWKAD